MKVYLSGKITGQADYLEKFAAAEERLTKEGFDVINPARVNDCLPKSTSYWDYMRMAITMLEMADAIYMLKGWEDSKGARLERKIAEMRKIVIVEENV